MHNDFVKMSVIYAKRVSFFVIISVEGMEKNIRYDLRVF